MSEKRKDYISWDEYFMGIAQLSAMRSKDPNTQVGACIVSKENKILSMGYNGFPKGCDDDEYPWNRDGDVYDSKYAYVTHSELNAILNPCNECAKAIIQAGIEELVYADDKYHGTPANLASRRMLKSAGVKMTPYQRSGREIQLKV